MEKEILALLRKGVSLDEIKTQFVADHDVADVAKAIKAAKKVYELDEVEAKEAQSEAESKKVDAMVEKAFAEKMKSIKVDALGSPVTLVREKRYSPVKKDLVEMNGSESEAYRLFQKQMACMITKDGAGAKKASDAIDQYNAKAAGDPVRSDSAAVGGYAIPTEVDMEIHQLTWAQSVMLNVANTQNIIVEGKIYPVMYNTTTVDITSQATDLTESQQVFTNPTVEMKRFGTFSNVSNTIINQRGDIVPAIIAAFASSRAEFLDYRLAVGNVTGASQAVDGIVFDTLTTLATPVALGSLTLNTLRDLKNSLSAKATGRLAWIGNRKVIDAIGLLENTAGNLLFPAYVNGGSIAPLGIQAITNPLITSVLDVGGDNNTGGTDDVLILADFSKFIVGVDASTRIESTNAYDFVGDNTTFKIVGRYGAQVLMGSGTAGIVAVAQELTN
jgi:HK97 family phage major capsid protein